MYQASIAMAEASFHQLSTRYDHKYRSLWAFMDAKPRACFTPELIKDLENLHALVARLLESREFPVHYLVLASRTPGIFNLGGDLDLFTNFIKAHDRSGLLNYAESCINRLSRNIELNDFPITTIALVQGNALGGGFEAALSFNTIIAERSAQMGLPEIIFNLFPGMGAYSFLSRRLSPSKAKEFITSGKTYRAEELYEMGIVNVLAEDGQGKQAVDDYIKKHSKNRNAQLALQQVHNRVTPISHDELLDVTRIWVDAALKLQSRDLAMMQRLVSAQEKFEERFSTDQERLYKRRSEYEWRQQAATKFPLYDHRGEMVYHERRKSQRRASKSDQ